MVEVRIDQAALRRLTERAVGQFVRDANATFEQIHSKYAAGGKAAEDALIAACAELDLQAHPLWLAQIGLGIRPTVVAGQGDGEVRPAFPQAIDRATVLDHLDRWWRCCLVQQDRAMTGDNSDQQEADALLYLMALRQMLRVAELAIKIAPTCRAALDALRSELPDLVRARDTLEHFDDYQLGSGKKQKGRSGNQFNDGFGVFTASAPDRSFYSLLIHDGFEMLKVRLPEWTNAVALMVETIQRELADTRPLRAGI